ncbi:MAG: rod shape-determining protein MreC [Actinomycetota bacterium]
MVARSRPRSVRLLVVILVSICLAVITIDYRQGEDGPLSGFGRTAIDVMAPLQEGIRDVTRPLGDFFVGITEAGALKNERDELQQQVEEQQTQLAGFSSLEARHLELLEQERLADRVAPASVSALVLGYPPNNFERTITIDRGTADGVAIDMPVIASAGLVGTVTRAATYASTVRLIIDQRSFVTAKIDTGEAAEKVVGGLVGKGDAPMEMDLVAQDAAIDVAGTTGTSPIVYTATYTINDEKGLYPPDVPIGTIERVYDDPAALQKTVTVRPFVDFASLEYVQVLQLKRDAG